MCRGVFQKFKRRVNRANNTVVNSITFHEHTYSSRFLEKGLRRGACSDKNWAIRNPDIVIYCNYMFSELAHLVGSLLAYGTRALEMETWNWTSEQSLVRTLCNLTQKGEWKETRHSPRGRHWKQLSWKKTATHVLGMNIPQFAHAENIYHGS